MVSLYFLGKYDVMLTIVNVLSNIFDVLFRCCVLFDFISFYMYNISFDLKIN